jgi:hypothetical protein
MDKFVEKVSTTKICYVEDGRGPGGITMSVWPSQDQSVISLIIGASLSRATRCSINKKDMAELINLLVEIQYAMKG